MNIALPSDLELYVENKMKTGEYNCESEVIHETLRLLVERDWVRGKRLEELRSEIEKGRAEIKAGNFIEISLRWSSKTGQRTPCAPLLIEFQKFFEFFRASVAQ